MKFGPMEVGGGGGVADSDTSETLGQIKTGVGFHFYVPTQSHRFPWAE